ncbi:MAG: CPBP family intramembrane metalloprotease [Deltaproteobacteria bacterium]|nr:CPBP family intramembrane metalloprotease [Deltaproteobacteria bacterium]
MEPNTIDTNGSSKSILKEILVTFTVVTALLSILFHAGLVIPWLGRNLGGVAALLFLYAASRQIRHAESDLPDYGISARPFVPALGWGVGSIVVILGLFVALYLAYYSYVCAHGGLLGALGRNCHHFAGVSASIHLPKKFWLLAASELVVVAIPEEIFFRGYVQTRLNQIFTARIRVGNIELGWAVVIQAALFGLGHFLVDFNPLRLAVAIPALAFGVLREASGGVGASALLHASSNLVVGVLDATYFLGPS